MKEVIVEFEVCCVEFEKIVVEKLVVLQVVGEKLNGQLFEIMQKLGVDGCLFGLVMNGDVVELLKKVGYEVEKL